MALHTLRPFPGSRKKRKRVGRGHGSGHGTTATRGTKGQRARSGGSKGLKLKGMKQMLLRIPKVRGFRSIHAKPHVVNLGDIGKVCGENDTITLARLKELNLLDVPKSSKREIKVLGRGQLTKKITITGLLVSHSAKIKIEKVGGSVA